MPSDSIPIIGMFDVIEHLDDPGILVGEACRVLEPSGVLVVTVPALSWLWSESDNNAGHQRRYTRRSLDAFMVTAGFERVMSAYLFVSLVVPAALLRSVPYRLDAGVRRPRSRQRPRSSLHRARVSTDRGAVLAGERAIARRVPLPVGPRHRRLPSTGSLRRGTYACNVVAERFRRLVGLARRLPLPPGTYAVGAGIAIIGVTSYVFQIIVLPALADTGRPNSTARCLGSGCSC